MIIGDFNDICSNNEKWEGRKREKWTCKYFKEMVRDNQLMDVVFNAVLWTWTNN